MRTSNSYFSIYFVSVVISLFWTTDGYNTKYPEKFVFVIYINFTVNPKSFVVHRTLIFLGISKQIKYMSLQKLELEYEVEIRSFSYIAFEEFSFYVKSLSGKGRLKTNKRVIKTLFLTPYLKRGVL